MLAVGQFKGRTMSRDDNTTGSEDASTTGLRNREETRGEVEMLVRRLVWDKVDECPAHAFGC